MRMKEVRAMLTDAIMAERERCANICEDMAAQCLRHQERGTPLNAALALTSAAGIIKSANPPHIQVVRPETAVADPSKITQHTIVAGQGLVGDEIVDRFRMQAKNGPMSDMRVVSQGEVLNTIVSMPSGGIEVR